MGWFNGRAEQQATDSQAELATLVMQGEDMIEQLATAHRTWGLGTAERWDLNQRTGEIKWTFPDRVATAPAQILGSYNRSTSSWMWAWANDSILPSMSRDAEKVRAWAAAHGHSGLGLPRVEVDEETAGTIAAVALRITGAAGFYRGGGRTAFPVITFGPVTLTAADGAVTSFAVDVE
ncbi:DUF6882 domain-containing protein [Streptomyces sp. NPDC056785]|uniref:DUF6882 domain-containing protein n=1 Tax=Streptomyces sp. NPDC056785 TaxID=3345944 RepID=UPI0036765BE0